MSAGMGLITSPGDGGCEARIGNLIRDRVASDILEVEFKGGRIDRYENVMKTSADFASHAREVECAYTDCTLFRNEPAEAA